MILHSEQDAIKQAVEAGYEPPVSYWWGDFGYIAVILQAPAFWQALGKARGWGKPGPDDHLSLSWNWYTYALRYFEVKLSSDDLTQFWETLP